MLAFTFNIATFTFNIRGQMIFQKENRRFQICAKPGVTYSATPDMLEITHEPQICLLTLLDTAIFK